MSLLRKTRADAAPKTVLAASLPLEGPRKVRVGRSFKEGMHDWQKEAWYFYDAVGEFRAAVNWIANAVSKADLFAAEVDEETNQAGEPTQDARVQKIASAVLGGAEQRSSLLRMLAVQWQVPGEGFIIVRPTKAGLPDEWLVLSGRKVTYRGDTWSYTDPRTLSEVVLGPRDLLARVWSPHPNDPIKSDSAARPALPILREIEKSSQHIAATLDSRLGVAGILPIPSELNFPRAEGVTLAQAFTDYFMDVVSANITSPGTAEARVPVIAEMPGELIPQFSQGFLDLATAFDGQVVELRADSLERLAGTLDMPRETARGTTEGMNHWGSWKVEEDAYKIYIEPLLGAVGDALTREWFHPALRTAGVPNPENFVLAWGTTSIVSRPDRAEELKEAWSSHLISDDYYRSQLGFPDDATPTGDELTTSRAWELVKLDPSLATQRDYAELLGLPFAEPSESTQSALPAAESTSSTPAGLPDANSSGEPPDGLMAAAEFAVYDALSRAGKRLLTREFRGQFSHVKAEELYLTIPHERDSSALLEGSFAFIDEERYPRLTRTLHAYAEYLIRDRRPYDRDELRGIL